MNILVTGATGFIGKHLVNRLLRDKHNVFCTLLPTESNPFTNEVVTCIFGKSSITDVISFLSDNKIDGVIHLASIFLATHKPEDISSLMDSNIKFGAIILESAVQAKVKWFVNTGTFWQNYQDADYCPVNLYAATKQAFEDIAKYYYETEKIRFATLRLSDTFGKNDTRAKVFNLWDKISKTGETLEMSAGEQIIDISYIDDVINAFSLLANQLHNSSPEILNGAVFAMKADKRYTLKELASIFEDVTGKKLNINWGAKPYREREVMVPWDKGNTIPSYKPLISIETAIKKTLG